MNGVFFSVAHSARFDRPSCSIDIRTPLSSLDPFNLINMGWCADVDGDNPGGFKYPATTTPAVKGEILQGKFESLSANIDSRSPNMLVSAHYQATIHRQGRHRAGLSP